MWPTPKQEKHWIDITSFLIFALAGQIEALLPLLHQRDVFVRMATGSGKSLCMFLGPLAVSDKAIGLVISPLKALMNQQVLVPCCHYCVAKY